MLYAVIQFAAQAAESACLAQHLQGESISARMLGLFLLRLLALMRSGLFFVYGKVLDSHCLTAKEVMPLRPVNAKPVPDPM